MAPAQTSKFDLVADIGGTNTRVALAQDGALLKDSVSRFRNVEFPGLDAALHRFLANHNGIECSGACVAVAGPVRDGQGTLTNIDWELDEASVARATGAETAVVFNDLQAQGHGLERLQGKSVRTLLEGPATLRGSTKLVVGVGTGFNVAPVYTTPMGRIVPPAEAGHISLPVRTEQDLPLTESLSKAHGFASVEDMISGRGFEHVYLHLAKDGKTAAEIMELVDAGDTTAVQTARMFVEMLGVVTGDLALVHLPFGGIYFSGGVARAFAPLFGSHGFENGFRSKGRFSDFMSDFPVFVIEDDYAALSGCAAYLEDHRDV